MSHYLTPLFSPNSIAVIGASEQTNTVGAIVFKNLLDNGYTGKLYPINPRRRKIYGKAATATIQQLEVNVELAIITTPPSSIAELVSACAQQGIKTIMILSPGSHEPGLQKSDLNLQIRTYIEKYAIRILGPNSLGIIHPAFGFNASFYHGQVKTGNIALISQSGALATAILDEYGQKNGFSHVIALDNSVDISFSEILDYLITDKATTIILLYIEHIRNARHFMSGLRAAARIKPIITLKTDYTNVIFHHALQRAGAIRVKTIPQLFAAAKLLNQKEWVQGNQLGVISNSSATNLIIIDYLSGTNITLGQLSTTGLNKLSQTLPKHATHTNPINLLGNASAKRYREVLQTCINDEQLDAILIILTPQVMSQPLETAQAVIDLAQTTHKPLLTCWLGGNQVEPSRTLLQQNAIPTFVTLEEAIQAFLYLTTFHHAQQLLKQVPSPLIETSKPPDIEGAHLIVDSILAERRKHLSEIEAKALLSSFRIPILCGIVARSPNEALLLAETLGFPITMKIHSAQDDQTRHHHIRHHLDDAVSVRSTYNELSQLAKRLYPDTAIDGILLERTHTKDYPICHIGVITDPSFGAVIRLKYNTAPEQFILPPLNPFLARSLITPLSGHQPELSTTQQQLLEDILLRISEMVCELPWLQQLNLKLQIDQNKAIALSSQIQINHRPFKYRNYQHLAIHPYPTSLIQHWQSADGTDIIIRPITPADAELEQNFVRHLSERSKYFRFMQALHELSPEMLIRLTQIDYDREMALIAITQENENSIELGSARYTVINDGSSCEFSIVIADHWQDQGLGFRLLSHLIEAASARNLKTIYGEVFHNNTGMLHLAKALGFKLRNSPDDPHIKIISRCL